MPTKRARFGFQRSEWGPPGRGFTTAQRLQLRAICRTPAFRRDVLDLARLYDEGRRLTRAASETPAEAGRALRALHADALAIGRHVGKVTQLPYRARFLERLETVSATAAAFLHAGALRTGLRKVDLIDLGAADPATRKAWAEALAAGVAEADAIKGRNVQRGATLERGTAERLAAIFAGYGVRFAAGNGNNKNESAAVVALGLIMPGNSRDTLARYALHAIRARRQLRAG